MSRTRPDGFWSRATRAGDVRGRTAALQEIDARVTRAAALDPFSYFAELFSWTTVAARTIMAADGHYGHILMSRWPLESLGTVNLSVPCREPRKAIVGAVSSPLGRIAIVAAHLGLFWGERRVQLRRLKSRLAELAELAELDERPMIALGDFNDIRAHGRVERALCPPLEPAPASPSTRPPVPQEHARITVSPKLVNLADDHPRDRPRG